MHYRKIIFTLICFFAFPFFNFAADVTKMKAVSDTLPNAIYSSWVGLYCVGDDERYLDLFVNAKGVSKHQDVYSLRGFGNDKSLNCYNTKYPINIVMTAGDSRVINFSHWSKGRYLFNITNIVYDKKLDTYRVYVSYKDEGATKNASIDMMLLANGNSVWRAFDTVMIFSTINNSSKYETIYDGVEPINLKLDAKKIFNPAYERGSYLGRAIYNMKVGYRIELEINNKRSAAIYFSDMPQYTGSAVTKHQISWFETEPNKEYPDGSIIFFRDQYNQLFENSRGVAIGKKLGRVVYEHGSYDLIEAEYLLQPLSQHFDLTTLKRVWLEKTSSVSAQ